MSELVQNRLELAKNTFIFQLKLGLDAVRDLLLSPISIVLAIWDLIKGHSQQQSYYYQLMEFGHKTDKWLNLFSSPLDKDHEPGETAGNTENDNVDQLLKKIEAALKAQHKQAGVANAKASISKYLERLNMKE